MSLMSEFALPMPAMELTPHRPPMNLIDRLVEADENSVAAEAFIAEDNIFLDEQGCLDRVAYIELTAQTYAAMLGYNDHKNGLPVREGFLVAVRNMHFFDEVKSGDRLTVRVRTVGSIEGFSIADGEISFDDGRVVAAGSLKIWVPKPAQSGGVEKK